MNFRRVWAMPNADTFDVEPIGALVKYYLHQSKVSIDPFARNKRWATYTNDLNPSTEAEYHLDVWDFLKMLVTQGVQADLVIFDPPYSPRQIKEVYDSIGLEMGTEGAWRTHRWGPELELVHDLLSIGGIVITCGWNTMGMGISRPYEQIELLDVCHGAGHNDTLVLVERKIAHQPSLFSTPSSL